MSACLAEKKISSNIHLFYCNKKKWTLKYISCYIDLCFTHILPYTNHQVPHVSYSYEVFDYKRRFRISHTKSIHSIAMWRKSISLVGSKCIDRLNWLFTGKQQRIFQTESPPQDFLSFGKSIFVCWQKGTIGHSQLNICFPTIWVLSFVVIKVELPTHSQSYLSTFLSRFELNCKASAQMVSSQMEWKLEMKSRREKISPPLRLLMKSSQMEWKLKMKSRI